MFWLSDAVSVPWALQAGRADIRPRDGRPRSTPPRLRGRRAGAERKERDGGFPVGGGPGWVHQGVPRRDEQKRDYHLFPAHRFFSAEEKERARFPGYSPSPAHCGLAISNPDVNAPTLPHADETV